jgi:hypothetical protein
MCWSRVTCSPRPRSRAGAQRLSAHASESSSVFGPFKPARSKSLVKSTMDQGPRVRKPRRFGRGARPCQPARAGLAELLHRHALIASAIFGRQGVTPAAVDTLMDEGLSAAVPECATERRPSSRPGGCAYRSRRWATKSRCRLHGTHEPEGRCPRVGERRSSPISRSLSAGRLRHRVERESPREGSAGRTARPGDRAVPRSAD